MTVEDSKRVVVLCGQKVTMGELRELALVIRRITGKPKLVEGARMLAVKVEALRKLTELMVKPVKFDGCTVDEEDGMVVIRDADGSVRAFMSHEDWAKLESMV